MPVAPQSGMIVQFSRRLYKELLQGGRQFCFALLPSTSVPGRTKPGEVAGFTPLTSNNELLWLSITLASR